MTPSWGWDCIMSCNDPELSQQALAQRSKRKTGPVGNWIFDLILDSMLAQHVRNSNTSSGIHPSQSNLPLTIIMSRHHHTDSGTIPSMMSVQHELKDNTIIVGKRISHSLPSHAHAFLQSLVHRAISQRRRSARLEIALPNPSIIFSNPPPLHRHSRLSSGCFAMASCPRASR